MTKTNPLNLEKTDYSPNPFPHFHSSQALDVDVATQLLQWLETVAPWELVESDFYEQYEFNLKKVEIPNHLSFLIDCSFASSAQDLMINTFNVALENNVEIVAHKLVPGQSIRIHNDYIEGAETHRLVIHLNSGWQNTKGGLLVIFASSDPEDICRVFTPLHNSAVGFAILENSHHAVSKICCDARYSLVFSFRAL